LKGALRRSSHASPAVCDGGRGPGRWALRLRSRAPRRACAHGARRVARAPATLPGARAAGRGTGGARDGASAPTLCAGSRRCTAPRVPPLLLVPPRCAALLNANAGLGYGHAAVGGGEEAASSAWFSSGLPCQRRCPPLGAGWCSTSSQTSRRRTRPTSGSTRASGCRSAYSSLSGRGKGRGGGSTPRCPAVGLAAPRARSEGSLTRLRRTGAPCGARAPPPVLSGHAASLTRTNRTRRVPHPVLIGHAASLTPYTGAPCGARAGRTRPGGAAQRARAPPPPHPY